MSHRPDINFTRYTLSIGVLISSLFSSAAVAQGIHNENWKTGFGQGILEYVVHNGPGNSFNISCDVGATDDAKLTSILVSIRDKSPPANSTMRIFIEQEEFSLIVDQYGSVRTDNRVNADNFIALWDAVRRGTLMRVLFEDGQTSTFSLRGSANILERDACKTAFY